jgi:16S rRNA (uracil1498-N3)-methyltransferase
VVGRDREGVATFHGDGPLAAGAIAVLGEGAAHHMRVRRIVEGTRIRVTNGLGAMAGGTISRIRREAVDVALDDVEDVPRPRPLVLCVPVADRDRMLWLAEKATELGVSVWQPVLFARSRSVSPRGEGDAFRRKVQARMISALEQSSGAWLPELRDECTPEELVSVVRAGARFLLDRGGASLASCAPFDDVALVLGPEGGFEDGERGLLVDAGWRAVSLAVTTLRFETAGVAAAAIVRGAQVAR